MRIPFRHGIIKDAPGFLAANNDTVNLVVPPNSAITLAIADKDTDYLVSEPLSVTSAWAGPFLPATDYWLFWDIDVRSGALTRSFTTLEPVVGATAPATPQTGQMWFDTTTNTHFEYTSTGRWKRVIRVIAAQYNGTFTSVSATSPLFTGTQIGNVDSVNVGAIVFDNAAKPIKRDNDTFFNTESVVRTTNIQSAQLKFGAVLTTGEAQEPVTAYSVVRFTDFNQFALASDYTDVVGLYGLVTQDLATGESDVVTVEGVVSNPLWDWSALEVGSKLYVNSSGQLTPTPVGTPPSFATVVDETTILVQPSISVTVEGDVIVGATVPNLFSTIAVAGQDNVVADTTSDTLTLVAGSGIEITTNALTDSVTIASTGGGSTLIGQTTNSTSLGVNAGGTPDAASTNVAIGLDALSSTAGAVSNSFNVAIGFRALESLTIGDSNIAIGEEALRNSVDGIYNIAIGYGAGSASIQGESNVFIGTSAGSNISTGGSNVLIGDYAGVNFDQASTGNVVIGFFAGPPDNLSENSNSLWIHNEQSDTPLIYGEFDSRFLMINGQLILVDQVSAASAEINTTSLTGSQTYTLPDKSGTFAMLDDVGGGGGSGVSVVGASSNLIITNNTATPLFIVDVDADEVVLKNVGGDALLASDVNLSIDIRVTGVNGVDITPLFTNSWYHIFVISDGVTTSGLLSLASDTPTMPVGYTYKALVGAIRYNGSSNFVGYYQAGKKFWVTEVPVTFAAPTNTYAAVSLSSGVPATAKSADLLGEWTYSTGTASVVSIASRIDGFLAQRHTVENGSGVNVI
jgi:hypothetical protein